MKTRIGVSMVLMHVLIIEDNEKLAASIKKGLEKEGFAADVKNNGEEAAEHFITNYSTYDVVILDLMLPGRSGLDITMSVRERGITVPIIILTAVDDMAHKLSLLNAGADDYVVKPFSFEELVARIRALIRRPTEALPNELIFGQLVLSPATRIVTCNGEPISLTTKEFSILELFLRNQVVVLNREFILDHVWDYNYNSLSNTVDVHIKNLRKKLGDSPAGDIIETVTGVGYRLKQ